MTGLAASGLETQGRPERRSARMVLDVDFALEGLVADLLRAELDQGTEVHVVLLSIQRHRWRADAPSQSLARYLTHRPDQEGIVLR